MQFAAPPADTVETVSTRNNGFLIHLCCARVYRALLQLACKQTLLKANRGHAETEKTKRDEIISCAPRYGDT